MRKLVAGLFVSLDGVAEAPNRWVFPYFSDEVYKVVSGNMESSDAMLMGRHLYEEWAAYWPDKTAEDDPYADFINAVPKYVASTTMGSVEWNNATLLKGDLRTAIQDLKDQPGKEIGMTGSLALTGWLLREGLLDELSLLVFPVVVGNGKRLFDGPEQVPLKLVESAALDTGVLSVRYTRDAGKE